MNSPTRRDLGLAFWVGLVALAPRLFGLEVFLTADEPKSWFGRSIQFLDALARGDWVATFDSPAPGVTTMWAGAIGLLLDYARQGWPGPLTGYLATVPFDPLDPAILPLIRLPIVLAATLTAVLTYWWGRAAFGRLAALLAALFIALDPFLLALTRILGHDGPVTLFIWLSLLAFLRSRQPGVGSREQGAGSNEQFTISNEQLTISNEQISPLPPSNPPIPQPPNPPSFHPSNLPPFHLPFLLLS
ncbi:MAG TPA: glycosyltransferase family 39 protein, partial [Anaerolineae bacterium]|nr:glycosyltransferase family 39 protein [Anaerolineae bacterium]